MTKSEFQGRIEQEIELIERHLRILKVVQDSEPIGIIRLAETMDLPQHKVRYSLRILEEEGLLEPSLEGAVTTKRIVRFSNNIQKLLTAMENTLVELKKKE